MLRRFHRSVLGLAAVVATLPAWSQTPDAEARAQVAGALSLTSGMKAAIAEAFAQNGKFPGKYSDAGLTGPSQISYANATLGQDGAITVSFNDKADPVLRGKILKVIPMSTASQDVVFYCLAPAIPEAVRPPSCS